MSDDRTKRLGSFLVGDLTDAIASGKLALSSPVLDRRTSAALAAIIYQQETLLASIKKGLNNA